jgi:hypothetical protein
MTPGFKDEGAPQIRALSAKLFGALVEEDHLGDALHRVLPPDLAAAPGVGFVHRKIEGADIYFVVNATNRSIDAPRAFRSIKSGAERWSPIDGRVMKAVATRLAPYESEVIISPGRPEQDPRAESRIHTVDLSSNWTITIGGVSKKVSTLQSWTLNPEWAHYSGVAIYAKTFKLASTATKATLSFGEGTPIPEGSEHRAGSGMRAWLENPVREAAIVYVNGKRAGSIWCPPYELDVSLHGGENTLRIEVANLAVNAMVDHPEDDSKLTARFGERFQPQDMDKIAIEPSGILGPVRLLLR